MQGALARFLSLSALVEIPMTTTDLITADELLQMKDDGFRYELVRGELIKMSPPVTNTAESYSISPPPWTSSSEPTN